MYFAKVFLLEVPPYRLLLFQMQHEIEYEHENSFSTNPEQNYGL